MRQRSPRYRRAISARRTLFAALVLVAAPGFAANETPLAVGGNGQYYVEAAMLDLEPPPVYLEGYSFARNGAFTLSNFLPTVVGAVDMGGASARPELLFSDGARLLWLDSDGGPPGGMGSLPKTLTGMAAVDFVGGSRLDLVAAMDGELWAYNIDRPQDGLQGWQGPVSPPIAAVFLAVANVTGDADLDLAVTDGSTIWALDGGRGIIWRGLTPPPVTPDLIAGVDIGDHGGVGIAETSTRKLAIFNEGNMYTFEFLPETRAAYWSTPIPRRFRTISSAPVNLNYPDGPELGSAVLLDTLTESPIDMVDVTVAAGLAEPYEAGGDVHCPGATLTDVNGDGELDIYLARGVDSAQGTANTLWVGDGQGAFTKTAQAADPGNSTGSLVFDYDNDGDPDLYVINFDEPNVLYENTNGIFTDVTAATDPTPTDPGGDLEEGLAFSIATVGCPPSDSAPCRLDASIGATAGDINRDGYIDIYVANHLRADSTGQRDILYLNDGTGTFSDITVSSGIAATQPPGNEGSSQAVIIADINNDLWPDIYVPRKQDGPVRDQLFLNDGDPGGDGWDGTFTEYFSTTPDPLGNVTPAAMGITLGDYDNDGDLDVFLTDTRQMDLYRNLQADDGSFSLELVDPNPVEAPYLSWGATWADLDNDMNLDLHASTDNSIMDYLFQGDGLGGFDEVTLASGLGLARNARAVVAGDFDKDGRVDLFQVMRDPPGLALYHNETIATNHWLAVELEGHALKQDAPRSSRDALGARVEVDAGGVVQRRDVLVGGSTCASTSDLTLTFGLGEATSAEVTIYWPSGEVLTMLDVAADQRLTILEVCHGPGADTDTRCIDDPLFADDFESGARCDWSEPSDPECP